MAARLSIETESSTSEVFLLISYIRDKKGFKSFYFNFSRPFTGELRNQNAQNTGRKMPCSVWGGAKNSRMSRGGWYNAWCSKHRLRCSSHPLSHRPEQKGSLRRRARTYGLRHERSEGVAGKIYCEIIINSKKFIIGTCELQKPSTQRGLSLDYRDSINEFKFPEINASLKCVKNVTSVTPHIQRQRQISKLTDRFI